jgi:ABC-2 type transport system permease protein
MSRYLKLYLVQLKYAYISNFAYRGDLFMWIFVDLAWTAVSLLFFTALISNIKTLGGWNLPQMLLLLGIYRFFNATFWGILWPNMERIPKHINDGTLDLLITKPINSQFFLSTRHISINQISSIITGVALIYISQQQLGFSISITDIINFFTILISGTLILYALWFISLTIVFYTGRINNIVHLFPEIFSIAQYPTSAFPVIMQVIITFVIPVGVIAYTPARLLLHQVQWWEPFLPVIMAVIFLYLSSKFWTHAIKSYTSASS